MNNDQRDAISQAYGVAPEVVELIAKAVAPHIVVADTSEPLRSHFEALASDSYGFKRSRKGNYVNASVARDWKWFKQGMAARQTLTEDQVQWVVNDNAELGVKIGHQFFFLYKGGSLVYENGQHDDGSPMQWRPVFKREFGECAHPINHRDYSKVGTVSLHDSNDWKPLP